MTAACSPPSTLRRARSAGSSTLEGDLWGHPEVNSGGGAWTRRPSTSSGLCCTSASPTRPRSRAPPSPNGTSRPGDNLYTDSIVALDLATGELAWFHQVTPHDIFDRDQVHALLVGPPDGPTWW